MSAVFVLRFIEIAMSSFLAGFAFVVALRYARRWSKLPAEVRLTWPGLLPLHVWTVSLSYVLLLVAATVEIYERTGHHDHVTWRTFVLLPAYILGVVAMMAINRVGRSGHLRVQKRDLDVK